MSEGPGGAFGRRGAAWLAAIAAASLGAAAFLGLFGDALYDPPSFGADSFSRSAVGHRAFVELLRALGRTVVVSRHRTAEKAEDAPVALLEPRVGPDDSARAGTFEAIDGAARRLLVVLPKRGAFPDPTRPRFVAYAGLLPPEDPQRVLDALGVNAKVVRPQRSIGGWRGDLPAPTVDTPQLFTASDLRPVLETDEGILVGEIRAKGYHTIVLADPDVIATHGLARGDNAALAVALLDRLGRGDLPVIVDETLHGLEEQPSIARELLRFPLVLATASALAAAALLAWAALVRFGRPGRPAPLLAPGKLFLVDSTAALLRHGGSAGHAAQAYLRAAKDEIVHRLRQPGEAGETDAWLARAAEARGRDEPLRDVEERVRRLAARRGGGEEEAVRAAQAIHAFREEMTDGAHGDPRRDRAAQG
ncbi:MAG TPA: DUF4350 domain-containing protein [Anaeromyxobacter sp.]|nr:DUF4350 domain-containing protein [Anaeromyxobacter sp.]